MEQVDVSRLLDQAREGDKCALDSLVSAIYGDLRRIAASLMRGQLHGRTLQPTALVNEAWLRMASGQNRWENKAHFFGTAARAMRQVLTEEARRRCSQKRAGDVKRVTFRDLDIQSEEPPVDLLELNQALNALAKVDERYVRIIDLRYFAGCSLEEVAELTGRSLASVKRDWTYARAWLFDRITDASKT